MHSPNSDASGLPHTPYSRAAGHGLRLPELDADAEVDVAVIGGGVTGLSTALHAAQNGQRVALLEAKEVAWGASGRNSGHIPAATRQEPAAILKAFGPVYGPRIVHASREAPELVFGLAARHGMEVSACRNGGIQAAHTEAALAKLRRRVSDLKALGYELELLDARQTAERVGCRPGLYLGAVRDPAGGTLNPLAYARGLARAAQAAGAQLYERSAARSLARAGGAWQVKTARAALRARFVVLCTNGYSDGLLPRLWRSIVAVRAYQFMTPPLPEPVRRRILPGGEGFTDTRRMMSGVRLHADGRLHFSGIGPFFGAEREPDVKASLARMHQLFPELAGIGLDYWWSGWMAMNGETTWKLHELDEGLLAALGCNGRGVGLGTVYGRELAGFIAGKPAAELIMPFQPVRRIRTHSVRQPAVSLLARGYRVLDAMETREP